jgi:hypothetical protein
LNFNSGIGEESQLVRNKAKDASHLTWIYVRMFLLENNAWTLNYILDKKQIIDFDIEFSHKILICVGQRDLRKYEANYRVQAINIESLF